MKSNKHYKNLFQALSTINAQNIKTLDVLQLPEYQELYAEMWLSLENFINYCALASGSHLSADGKRGPGNAEKIRSLVARGVEVDDIRSNALVRVMSKLNLVLAQPLERQIPYCYTIVNNCVVDEFRRLPPVDVTVMSLSDTVRGRGDASDTATTLEDYVADPMTPETRVISQENVKEAFAARQAVILDELSRLARRPEEVFIRLCKHLGMKPAAVASLLMRNGVAESYAMVLMQVSERYRMNISDIRRLLTSQVATYKAFKLETNDGSQVSAQISRLAYRAEKRLEKCAPL